MDTNTTLKHADEQWPEEQKVGALRLLWRHRELLYSLVHRDIRSRYKQSVLGIAWAILQPVAMTVISVIIFQYFAKVEAPDNLPYAPFAFVGIVFWALLGQSLAQGSECLVVNFNLITKIFFPREVFPISAVVGRLVDLALGLAILVPMFLLYHLSFHPIMLLFIPIVFFQLCLTVGVVAILSSINLFYRDVRHVVPLITQIWMFLSPVMYPVTIVDEKYLAIYKINPMYGFLNSYRDLFMYHRMPDFSDLGYSIVVSVVVLIAGYVLFKKLEPRFAEMI